MVALVVAPGVHIDASVVGRRGIWVPNEAHLSRPNYLACLRRTTGSRIAR